MNKKIINAVCALVLVFGSAAVLPEGFAKLDSAVIVSAETFGDYEYEILENGTVEITGYNGDDEEVNIPSAINGKKVTSIGDEAFEYSEITSVTIPDTVTSIGECSFNACFDLESITIPSSVKSIGGSAFSDTIWLEKQQEKDPLVIVNNIIVEAGTCEDDVVIPSGVTSIADGAFYNSYVTGVTIPDTVTEIGERAFEWCDCLEEISIPGSIKTISDSAFENCRALTKITISDGVESIETEAFYDCINVNSVSIPKSVNTIGYRALGYYLYDSRKDPNYTRDGFISFELKKVDNFVIYGYKGTAAETYAKENHFTFVELKEDARKKGDLNNNGKIDASDLLQVKSHIKKVKPLEGDDFTCADVDGNGAINAADLLKMKAHMKGVTPLWGE